MHNQSEFFSEHANDFQCEYILVGNKNDIYNRQVSYQQGYQLAQKISAQFFELSAKSSLLNLTRCYF